MEQCDECRWSQLTVMEGDGAIVYECHRFPPSTIVIEDEPTVMWHQVNAHDWCGEWVGRPDDAR